MGQRILLVEDDGPTRELLADGLRSEQYEVTEVADAASARATLASATIDVAIVDLGLPDASGFDLVRDTVAAAVPAIILSGRTSEADRVQGLDLGADDYVVKPFSIRELSARVRRTLRTAPVPTQPVAFGDIVVDPVAREVRRAGTRVDLTRKEFDLLLHLASRPKQALSREALLQGVWHSSAEWQTTATVTEHIRRLRAKLETDQSRPRHLITVTGLGYRFDP